MLFRGAAWIPNKARVVGFGFFFVWPESLEQGPCAKQQFQMAWEDFSGPLMCYVQPYKSLEPGEGEPR